MQLQSALYNLCPVLPSSDIPSMVGRKLPRDRLSTGDHERDPLVVQQLLRCQPGAGVFAEAKLQEIIKRRRHVLGKGRAGVLYYAEQGRHGSEIEVRRGTCQQLNDSGSDAPDVRGRRGRRHLDNLRGHPVGSPCHIMVVFSWQSSGVAHSRRNSEVSEFDCPLLGGQDVSAFDVSMDDALSMQIVQPLQNLLNVDSDQTLRETSKLLDRIR
mmetsp:Transcript_46034/g.144393  ORF Transcript_46034/g.144393 Transcript_46034/m.144393 type:complete len:212 (-) Transcript_46034:609-1244(-)